MSRYEGYPRIFATRLIEDVLRQSDLTDLVAQVMETPCGQALLFLGYPPHVIKRAIIGILSESVWDVSRITSEALTHTVVELDYDDEQMEAEEALDAASLYDDLRTKNRRLEDEIRCKVCKEKERSMIFFPCCHYVTCIECCDKVRHCPICRKEIITKAKVYT